MTYSSRNVFALLPPTFSPPSANRTSARPPAFNHFFISENSNTVKASLGPPKIATSASFSLSLVISSLFLRH